MNEVLKQIGDYGIVPVVKIDDVYYYVTVCLENGEFFNEYQLEIKEDA